MQTTPLISFNYLYQDWTRETPYNSLNFQLMICLIGKWIDIIIHKNNQGLIPILRHAFFNKAVVHPGMPEHASTGLRLVHFMPVTILHKMQILHAYTTHSFLYHYSTMMYLFLSIIIGQRTIVRMLESLTPTCPRWIVYYRMHSNVVSF